MRRPSGTRSRAAVARTLTVLALLLAPALARAAESVLVVESEPAPAAAPEPADCIGGYCASDAIYQFAPSAAFAASLFEGPTRFGDVLRLGDFGLGGTSPLEGEVIILDGVAYHASPLGELEILSPTARTPFAFVKHFRPDRRVELPATASLDDLSRALDALLPSPNVFYAARIDALFPALKLRSVARQHPPYPSLAEVIQAQNVFDASDIDGTLVGFRFPAYLGGVNAAGWHFHFVDDARRVGGHVLDVRTLAGTAAIDQSHALTLVLPDDAAFDEADLRDASGAAAFGAAVRPPVVEPLPDAAEVRPAPTAMPVEIIPEGRAPAE